MGTFSWLVAGAALGLAVPFVMTLLQRRRDTVRVGTVTATARRERVRPANPFAAVMIEPSLDSPCEAVQGLGERRYLAVRAPALPVPGCDQARCRCRYIRHADRRDADDRRDMYSTFSGVGRSADGERRKAGRQRRRTRQPPADV